MTGIRATEPYWNYEDIGVFFFVPVFLAAVVRLSVRMHFLRPSDLVTPGLALQSFVIIFLSVSLFLTLKWRYHRPVIAPLGWVVPDAFYTTLAAGIASAVSIAFLAHLRHQVTPTIPATDFLVLASRSHSRGVCLSRVSASSRGPQVRKRLRCPRHGCVVRRVPSPE